ncbi:hypothetical protein ABB37_06397 [Leptomonas pyrrhocoris]|uniref:Uncharacterized protein n=1 Tax=Leptomonas pyrrhocoris TaxID=157538 RepID=A0A0M9FXY2_LEPPY|nr:hypothetical protein ABB37_06397 [Leptomonas pyrrhocoris]XP_015656682.1 hypothetical protein ABB37_06397 [Leptomonas pyrrhocoris]KPA78242.1 hypothetical protein ABB37_06397 [Leptomonas pyrrhocoris]KPA78243.1 hypothetical protein ABB37_06397 [Leptomonas pyrrhocoris]|eukprot:XP_015656681.1 hypothetical protein ABB37_06397 [Leptomonas pyrrhocoris]
MNSVTQWCTSTAAGVWNKTRSTVQLVYHVGDQLRLVYNTANSREERKRDLDATVLRVGGFVGTAVLLIIVDAHGGVPNTLRRLRALLTPEESSEAPVAVAGNS